MTERLYYTDPRLMEFDAKIIRFEFPTEHHPHIGIVLDRTAFYPASGGQMFDTGWLNSLNHTDGKRLEIVEVIELPNGDVAHCIELKEEELIQAVPIHAVVDRTRRRDHMQQHTGQHLLSAVFIALFNAPTVSFHMGDETCTIDLDVKALSAEQVREAECRSNEIITDDVPVEIKFAGIEEAQAMGVRKIPPDLKEKLRLIEIRGHDLTACGGTHVGRTGEIGAILIRKSEKVKQGMRVEFVCGARAIAAARRDFETLASAAGLFSGHIYDVPEQIRKTLEESKSAGKREQKTLAELAELMAARLVSEAREISGIRVVKRAFSDRDLAFLKLLAQKLASHPGVVALLASTAPQASLVFAQSAGGLSDMGALMKDAMGALGGRGGGSRDLAQGGAPAGADVAAVLHAVAAKL